MDTTSIALNITFAIFCLIISVIILISLALSEHGKERKSRIFVSMVFVNIIMLASSIIWFLLNGNPGTRTPIPLLVTECIKASCGPVMLILYTHLILVVLREKTFVTKRIENIALLAIALCIADILIIIIEPFAPFISTLDENNQFIRNEWFAVGYILTFVCMAINTGILIIKRKCLKNIELLILIAYLAIPAIGVIIHSLIEGTPINMLSITVAIVFYFALIQNELSKQTRELEKELIDSKISVMLSQIKPHFLYNSLTAIHELCYEDPETAGEAIDEFSNYLRGNLESLSLRTPILFEKELQHVKTYLSLEKRRFEDRLNVVFDIQTDEFLIPILTLQMIVENAVRHGITKREEGGTVTIRTQETATDVVITVTDDGVGFDINEIKTKGLHVGIENAKNRLAIMSNGTLKIDSKPGTGTTVVIEIPKENLEMEQGEHEYTDS